MDKKMNFTIKLTIEEAKKLLHYFNDEFMESYDEFLTSIEDDIEEDDGEEYTYYEDLREVLGDLVYELKKEIRKKERIDSKNRSTDEKENELIKEKLNPFSLTILKKFLEAAEHVEPASLYKIYWYLHNSFDRKGEVIFSENSLEELLDMDRQSLERFLKHLTEYEIEIGNRKGKIIEKFRYLNMSTIKIDYNLYILKPFSSLARDVDFKIGKAEDIKVNRIIGK